ncbi:MAG TPA: tetratricopeptide repeat protein [Thermoanaerobaculia bacterium]|jgi:tetratricopeptide (TPR) repeat protein|nr:tetratricopeptide repeat protein [Thermoanaerobaculia bacterium]
MARHPNSIHALATSLRQLPFFSARRDPAGEARLYVRRALTAAAEERYDVALVFCQKALAAAPGDLAARLLVGRIYHHAYEDVDRAVEAYRKVITLAGYDADNPYCLAAREALDALVKDVNGEQ